MSISSELLRLSTAKTDIATEIAAKGVTVPSGTKLDGMPALIAQITGGGGGTPSSLAKAVNFRDYNGAILYSYTLAEAQALADLPTQPTHDGLTGQGWNYTLAQVQALTQPADIGAMYITGDGKTRLYVKLDKRLDVPLYWTQTVSDGVTVDWGDGSSETVAGTGNKNITHTYVVGGEYCITLLPAVGCTLGFGNGTSTTTVIGGDAGYRYVLAKAEIGTRVTSIGANAFRYCRSLSSITIPSNVTSIEVYAFYGCYSLSSITIPSSVTSIEMYAFYSFYSLSSITIPSSVTSIGANTFYGCAALSSITIPSSVMSIGANAFSGCNFVREYHFLPITPPTLSNTNAFTGITSDCIIYVPVASLNKYETATNWSTYASKMVGE